MVDRSNIAMANRLVSENVSIQQAIDNIDAGGRIIDMSIDNPHAPAVQLPAQVNTTYIDAPPTMYQAIRTLLVARQQAISTQLANLGIT
jgi:hypothetical protein